jgi:hypothetical protein
MKKILATLALVFFCAGIGLKAQEKEDKLDLPGDNLNLYAVLKLFQESETLEAFEKKLNEEDSKINNLDLDGDDKTDYIKVVDNLDGDVHTIVLQVAVSATETQDVAVFTVQKNDKGGVEIQLVGDEDLYGKDYIIEPNMEGAGEKATETPNPGYTGNTKVVNEQKVVVQQTTTVQISAWPIVRFIFLPTYIAWHSPWYWGYYPPYWHPWRPFYWHHYWGYHSGWHWHYHGYYRRWHYHRYPRWNAFYYSGRRSHSVIVINRRRDGLYRNTYSRPDTRKDGLALYNKTRPVNNKVPSNRPNTRPTTPTTRPTVPNKKPTTPNTRPVTKPPVNNRPVARPVAPAPRPAVRPAPKPAVRPAARPAAPATRTRN